jgi:hypothetical protein
MILITIPGVFSSAQGASGSKVSQFIFLRSVHALQSTLYSSMYKKSSKRSKRRRSKGSGDGKKLLDLSKMHDEAI